MDDALHRLLPYHVFQGAPPSREEFSQGTGGRLGGVPVPEALRDPCSCSAVDEEFEDVATQVLSRTCAMVNKYRRLLMVEAEVGAQTGVASVTSRGLTVFLPAAFLSFFRDGDD